MVMIVGRVIRLKGSLRGHRHSSSFEDHLGTAVGPDIYVVNFSSYIEIKDFRLAFGSVPVRVCHRHFAYAHVFSAKPPALVLMRLYYDNVLTFLVLHLDIRDLPFKVVTERVPRIFNINFLKSADPLIPAGQKASVVKVKLVLYICLPDIELYLTCFTERIAVNLCTYAHLYPAYTQLLELRAVNIDAAFILHGPAGIIGVLSVRPLCFYRKLKRIINIEYIHIAVPSIIAGTVLKQRIYITLINKELEVIILKIKVPRVSPLLFAVRRDSRLKREGCSQIADSGYCI